MTGATSGAGTAYPFGGNPSLPLLFRRIRVTWSLVFCVVFCRSLFVLLFFFFWALCCLSFFDLQILITSLWYLQTLLIQKQVIFMCTKFDIYVFIKSYFIIIHVVIWRILEYRYMYTQFFFNLAVHGEHRSFSPRPVKLQTSEFFSFYFDIHLYIKIN
jgi:hypothetical protein